MKTIEQQEAEFHVAASKQQFVVVTGALLHRLAERLPKTDNSDVAAAIRQTLPTAGTGSRRLTISHAAAQYLSSVAKASAAKAAKKDA